MSNRIGDWIQTYTGIAFYPLDPRLDEISIFDIAHSLSLQCRYAGHCKEFYTVAEHCCHIFDAMNLIKDRELDSHVLKAQALLHDASEAYLVDVPRPIKPLLKEYKSIENQLEEVIFKRFNIPYPFHPLVKEYDSRILLDEKAQNMLDGPDWNMGDIQPLGITLKFWSPKEAETNFLNRYYSIIPLFI